MRNPIEISAWNYFGDWMICWLWFEPTMRTLLVFLELRCVFSMFRFFSWTFEHLNLFQQEKLVRKKCFELIPWGKDRRNRGYQVCREFVQRPLYLFGSCTWTLWNFVLIWTEIFRENFRRRPSLVVKSDNGSLTGWDFKTFKVFVSCSLSDEIWGGRWNNLVVDVLFLEQLRFFWKQMFWHQKQLNCLNMSLTFGSRRAWRVETKPPICIDSIYVQPTLGRGRASHNRWDRGQKHGIGPKMQPKSADNSGDRTSVIYCVRGGAS